MTSPSKLKKVDRWFRLFAGTGLAVYSMLGGYDQLGIKIAMLFFGMVMMVSGICGA